MKDDQELEELTKIRDKLVERVYHLRSQLEAHENSSNDNASMDVEDFEDDSPMDFEKIQAHPEEKFVVRLVEATQHATGVYYTNINKTWLRDDVWIYNADVSVITLTFRLDLTVEVQNGKETKILDITCHFDKVESAFLQEIAPWVRDFTRDKQFSFLMSTFSEYGDATRIRNKILEKLESENFISIEQKNEGGGIIAFVHSPEAPENPLVEILWKITFNPKMLNLENDFNIEVKDRDFGGTNSDLLKDFCAKGLKKEDLEKLWQNLCDAVVKFE